MSTFVEYDKTNGKIKRILTSDEPPEQGAHIAYMQVPDSMEIDLSSNISDVIDQVSSTPTITSVPIRMIGPSQKNAESRKTPKFLEI